MAENGNNYSVDLRAKTTKFGSDNWKLSITTHPDEHSISLPNFNNDLSDEIISKKEFHNYRSALLYDYFSPPEYDKERLAKLWIKIVKWMGDENVELKALHVAYIIPSSINILGRSYTPKPWEPNMFNLNTIRQTEDSSIRKFSNLTIGNYDLSGKNVGDQGFVFHLSSYDDSLDGNAKNRTKYVNLHPSIHENEIINLFERANVIYLPNLTFNANVSFQIFD